ncbi:DNA repair exonuclease [Desulfococcaceae bacterium HSG9]|nr:DNA repair exonuclease [Desulfococcaceae bacterium HSG9]
MFKFIHTADIHLDSPLRGLSRYEGAPIEHLRGATRQAFLNLVQFAIDEAVEFVIIAGDLFDGDWKDYNTGLFFASQMSKLRENEIRVFIVSGNHDAASTITRKLHYPDNVYVFAAKSPETIRLDEIGVAIHGQSFAKRDITANLAVNYPSALPDYYNIGVLHTALSGREEHAKYAPCSRSGLLDKNYDYWALGHVHQREIVSESPDTKIVFPGIIQGRHIRETGPKGCTLVTIDDEDLTTIEHHSLDVLRWKYLKADISDIATDEALIESVRTVLEEASTQVSDRMSAVRLEITGSSPMHTSLHDERERWVNQLRALATDIGDAEIWLEKVIFNTSTPIDLDQLVLEDSPIGHLLRFINSVEDDLLDELALTLAPLKSKLPYEMRPDKFMSIQDIDWDNRDFMRDRLEQAHKLLIPRLLAQGNDK